MLSCKIFPTIYSFSNIIFLHGSISSITFGYRYLLPLAQFSPSNETDIIFLKEYKILLITLKSKSEYNSLTELDGHAIGPSLSI